MPWWMTFLFAFAVAAVAMGALCWQLGRHRDFESERRQYWNAKMKAEANYPDEPMNVADLIAVLQRHDPRATVVLCDQATYGAQVLKLGFGDVRPIQLGRRESKGLLLFEAWSADDEELLGPSHGVVLEGHR
jgi:hypothetical protein